MTHSTMNDKSDPGWEVQARLTNSTRNDIFSLATMSFQLNMTRMAISSQHQILKTKVLLIYLALFISAMTPFFYRCEWNINKRGCWS